MNNVILRQILLRVLIVRSKIFLNVQTISHWSLFLNHNVTLIVMMVNLIYKQIVMHPDQQLLLLMSIVELIVLVMNNNAIL